MNTTQPTLAQRGQHHLGSVIGSLVGSVGYINIQNYEKIVAYLISFFNETFLEKTTLTMIADFFA